MVVAAHHLVVYELQISSFAAFSSCEMHLAFIGFGDEGGGKYASFYFQRLPLLLWFLEPGLLLDYFLFALEEFSLVVDVVFGGDWRLWLMDI